MIEINWQEFLKPTHKGKKLKKKKQKYKKHINYKKLYKTLHNVTQPKNKKFITAN